MITLLIADDHPVFRAGIRALLALQLEIHIVGEATDGRQTVQMAMDLKPDVLLLDMDMPLMNGMDVVRHLKSAGSDVAILVLSGFAESDQVLDIMEAGVAGYLLKDEPLVVIVESIEKVFHGGVSLSRRVSEVMTSSRARRDALDESVQSMISHLIDLKITPHLLRVLILVAEGKNDKEIGNALHKSKHTVRNQVDSLRSITGSAWRPSLVAWFWRHQIHLLDVEDYELTYR